MELAAIITTLVVVVLQIITVALVIKTRKMVTELSKTKTQSSFSGERQDNRRDRDFRQNRRPGQENRNRPQAQVTTGNAAGDPVEKSLRDINLKLKNAERDQEFARKKFHDNISKDPQSRRRDSRDNNERRGNRDRDHQNNRGERRGSWQERNNKRDSSHPAEVTNEEFRANEEIRSYEPIVAPENAQEKEPVAIEPQTVETISTAQNDMTPTDFGSDDLQHGRKAMVKRRALKDEEEEGGSIGNERSTEIDSIQNESSHDRIESENDLEKSADATEIRFGRR